MPTTVDQQIYLELVAMNKTLARIAESIQRLGVEIAKAAVR
jgi:hypothetical protein